MMTHTTVDGDTKPAHDSAPSATEEFLRELLEWLNRRLAPPGVVIGPDTPLFAGGLINSIRILELIAWTERASGRTIPDRMVRMDNFGTASRISDVFGRAEAEPERGIGARYE